MDLPYLLKVDEYYEINSFPKKTYCSKCQQLENNYICKNCNEYFEKGENVIYNEDTYLNEDTNLNDNLNIFISEDECIKNVKHIQVLINDCIKDLNEFKEFFKEYNFIL